MKKPTGKLLFAYNTIARMEGRIKELEQERDAAVILAEQRRQFIVNGEELGYIRTPTSENDKAYHIFIQCGLDNSYALEAHNLEQQAKGVREFGEWYESTSSDSVFDDVTVGDLAKLRANSISADANQLSAEVNNG